MDFDLDNNRSSIMVGLIGQKQPGGDSLLEDDDLLNEVDLDDVLSDVKKEEFKGHIETGGKNTKRKLTIQEE